MDLIACIAKAGVWQSWRRMCLKLQNAAEIREDRKRPTGVKLEVQDAPKPPWGAQEQRVTNGIQSLLLAACLGAAPSSALDRRQRRCTDMQGWHDHRETTACKKFKDGQ